MRWTKNKDRSVDGVWSISSHGLNKKKTPTAAENNTLIYTADYAANLRPHQQWWTDFWAKSAIHVPDSTIEKQWYLEQYKLGSVARQGAPPISLQGVWTADNGRLPPWKGDFHHDLNTQLSYWPCYSGNHLEEGLNYFDHLETNKTNYRRYTKQYFGVGGLAVPGVTTLDGTEMGGWIQYSLSPTVSAWLAQHYYLQWRYSMDRNFLQSKAYPWLKETAVFLENITALDGQGHRKLQYSSSPEINDNAITAWFDQNTNYDLALMKFVFAAAAELAAELKLEKEQLHWQQIAAEFTGFSVAKNSALQFAPSMDYNQSHRHFSNAMAIHPLGLIKWEDGDTAQAIIKSTIHTMDSIGPDYWCGYSYSWMANMKARAKDGDGAAKSLDIFAKAFCSANSFHLNGDQTKSGYSKFTYRPFTLEGNFAFAAGLQEMLLQSYAGFIEIMPAVPGAWQNVSFSKLRAEGAFLISATKENGNLKLIEIIAEKGGQTKLKMPWLKWKTQSSDGIEVTDSPNGFVTLNAGKGGSISFTADE